MWGDLQIAPITGACWFQPVRMPLGDRVLGVVDDEPLHVRRRAAAQSTLYPHVI